ncbi:MAG: RIP metalloprotease RseP [Cellvibrionales bacterium]|nr:RIP metalloprotease RseP [Porticoccaceae bacterium]|tara:strand:+ start:13194 stop:14555 length:1362 start_codon:yes stop_codon:yes gene_type:complete
MQIFETLLYTFIALGLLVTIHEFGHFWVARRCGVKVERFSIGFGTPLVRWTDKLGTEFVLAALPLGGYVKMLDARTGEVAEEDLPFAFSSVSVWRRIAIVSAGPMANFILAVFAFWMIFLAGEVGVRPVVGEVALGSDAQRAGFERGMTILSVGDEATPSWDVLSKRLFGFVGSTENIPFVVQLADSNVSVPLQVPIDRWLRDTMDPVPLRELGISPAYELQSLSFAAIDEGSAAARAGLEVGDQVVEINGITIDHIDTFIQAVATSPNRAVTLLINRQDAQLLVDVVPALVQSGESDIGRIGVTLAPKGKFPDSMVFHVDHSLWSALVKGVDQTVEYSVFVVKSLGKLVVGDLSPKNLSGPITIAKVAGDSARAGVDNFIRFVAILSIMLGVMNLLPIPVLDGGHLVYYMVEVVKGSPVSDKVQIAGYKVGFTLLVGLMVVATFNDLTRAFL